MRRRGKIKKIVMRSINIVLSSIHIMGKFIVKIIKVLWLDKVLKMVAKWSKKTKAVIAVTILLLIVYHVGIAADLIFRQSIFGVGIILLRTLYTYINGKNNGKDPDHNEYVASIIFKYAIIRNILIFIYDYIHIGVLGTCVKVVIIYMGRRVKNIKIFRSKPIKKIEEWLYYIIKYVIEEAIREVIRIYNKIKKKILKSEGIDLFTWRIMVLCIILVFKFGYLVLILWLILVILKRILGGYSGEEEENLVIVHQYRRELSLKVGAKDFEEGGIRRENAIICRYAQIYVYATYRKSKDRYREIRYTMIPNYHIYSGDVVEMVQDHAKLPISVLDKKELEIIFKGLSSSYYTLYLLLEGAINEFGIESIQATNLINLINVIIELASELGDLLYEYVKNENKYKILLIVGWYQDIGQVCNIALKESKQVDNIKNVSNTLSVDRKKELKNRTKAYIEKYSIVHHNMFDFFDEDITTKRNFKNDIKAKEIKNIILSKFIQGEYSSRVVEYQAIKIMIEGSNIEKFVGGDYEYTVWFIDYLDKVSQSKK